MKNMYESSRNMQKCRCCLTEDCYKNINSEYYKSGRIEIYSKILFDTFGVQMSILENFKGVICMECVNKLQEAAAFKSQVLEAENTFVQQLMKLKEMDSSPTIENENKHNTCDKMQQCNQFGLHTKLAEDCFNDNDDVHCNGGQLEQEEEQMFNTKLHLMVKRQENAQSKSNSMDPNIKRSKRLVLSNKSKKDIVEIKALQIKKIPKLSKIQSKTKRSSKQTESSKNQRENTIKLLLNSNICLFTSYKTKFGCYYCKERFLDFKHLREHANMHRNDKYIVSSVNHMRGLSYKNVDISNLACKLCDQACQDLAELQTHLTTAHDVEFTGSEHFLTPYKLENGLQCVVCRQTFNTFLRLSIHMNSHSTNNVCEICGVSYINRLSLRVHVHALHTEKQCKLCPTTFLTNSTKARHMRRVHGVGDYKRYCLLCEKTFRYTYLLVEHNIKEHGAKRRVSECVECGKMFPSEANLKVHTRAVHMKERNFPCGACDMRFFTNCDRRRHERTHRDERAFACAHCHAHFKTKDSWRRHLKRQHADLAAHT